ncbi:MAG: hypothetical protein CML04_11845 [Pseudozobellia sp.]|nr:hypothetical protein [Pseudozobellia sp.]|tara:strand:+ start:1186 stop:3681 length:2496 start_codon:yes stop_codon:yes gene_type:complete
MYLSSSSTLPFLNGGGEMGKLTREKDWEKTKMGSPESWPPSIRPILSLLLNSKVPMFLFWGEDRICFYNDAYRPSLGDDGKHPDILGMDAPSAWPEIWETIQPLLKKVFDNGESLWLEDQLIPIYRNGQMEEVYWTFGYSPVLGDYGKIEGVFVTCTETTKTVTAMKDLEEKSNELQMAIDAAGLGTWDFTPQTAKVKINTKTMVWSGLKGDFYHAPRELMAVVDETDRSRVRKAVKRVTSTEGKDLLDISFAVNSQKTGKKRELRAVGRAHFDHTGTLERFNGTLQDITKQQSTLRNLRKKEERFRQLVHNAPIGIAIVDIENFVVKVVNEKALQIWQKSIGECQDQPIFNILPETRSGLEPILNEIIETKKPQVGTEYPFVLDRNGIIERGFFNFIFKPVLDNGKVVEIILVAFEVTDSVHAKFGIEETEVQFKNVFDQFPIAMSIIKGPDMVVETVNDNMLNDFWNIDRKAADGQQLNKILSKKLFGQLSDCINEAFETGKTVRLHDVLWESDKIQEDKYVDFSCHPLRELDDSVKKVIIVTDDITKRVLTRFKLENFSKRLEKQVEERTEQLKASNEQLQDTVKRMENTNAELESFAYIASHDLKEPLRKIQMFMERVIAFENENLSERSLQYMGRIDNAIVRMRTLIDELLAYSRTGSEDYQFETTDLRSVLENVLENLSATFEESEAIIDYDEMGTVRIIPFQIKQVFQNLLENSLKFTKENEPPKVEVTTIEVDGEAIPIEGIYPNGKYLKISFRDYGIGFDPQNGEKIFEIFQRLHGKLEYQGTGIGLAIVKKIMDNHKGYIQAVGRPDDGATFNLYFPLNEE